jgi:hypothetical protein
MFYFVATGDNTGAVTLNIDALGAKAVTRDGSVALAAGDIKSGEVVVVVYDGTRFQVVSQLNSAGDARFANVSIASSLYVGGVSTFVGNAGFSANVSIASALSVGGVAAITGATTIGGNLTLNGGTANGVLYLNGSKVATSGSALTFDGTNFTVGVSATTGDYKTFIQKAGSELLGLNASSGTLARIAFGNTTATFGSTQIIANAADLAFITNSAEQMRLTSTGLGIGTTSPTVPLDVQSNSSGNGIIIRGRVTANTGTLRFYANNGTTQQAKFEANDSTVEVGSITNVPLLLLSNGTERARITSGGDFELGTNAGTGTRTLTIQTNTSGDPTISLSAAGADAGSFWFERSTLRLYARASNTGGVYLASGGTSWTAVSDERKKDIIEPISNAAEKVASLRAVVGKYKTDKDGVRRSFLIAQDVQAVFPEAIDASDENELGLSYTDTIPLLVAAIKELTARVAQLETK